MQRRWTESDQRRVNDRVGAMSHPQRIRLAWRIVAAAIAHRRIDVNDSFDLLVRRWIQANEPRIAAHIPKMLCWSCAPFKRITDLDVIGNARHREFLYDVAHETTLAVA